MNFGSYAGGRVDDALVRDTTRARASKTRSPTGGEPSPVPSAAKKRAYWVWFAAILCLETAMVRRSTIELNPESTGAVRSTFLLHTQALNIAVHLLVDLSALRSLNALHPRWGVMYPGAFRGAPALRASEERAVVVRHFFKLLIRAPMVNCVLLGGKLDGFHAYQVRQLVMMVTSPTFFATLFAVKTARGLCALALVNVGFVTACAFSVPFAFKYSPDLREGFLNGVDPIHANVPRRFAELAVALAAAPFAARAAVLVFRLDAQPPSPRPSLSLDTTSDLRKWEGDTAGPGPRTTSAEKMKGLEGKEREEEARPEQDARAFSLEKAQLVCGAAPEEDAAAREALSAGTDGFTPELSASALCFRGPESQCVTVRGVPLGVSLRVTFEGRVLRSTGELIRDAESGAARVLLRVWPPEPESGVGVGDGTPFDRGQSEGRFEAPFGRAWVSPGYVLEHAAGRKGVTSRAETRLTFKPVGESVALLFLRDPETAREVNDATSLIRDNMNGVLANRLVMRIGNCIARATFNENENAVMLDLTATVGMRRCQRMLSALLARVHGEGEDADISQANSLQEENGGAAEGTRAGRGRSAARGPGGGESPGCSDDSDAVDGPEAAEAAGGARRGFLQTKFGGGETAAAAGGDAPGGDLRRRTARRRVSRR